MSARLDRCPFCGKKVTIGRMSDGDGATDDEIKAIKKALIEKWNRRV